MVSVLTQREGRYYRGMNRIEDMSAAHANQTAADSHVPRLTRPPALHSVCIGGVASGEWARERRDLRRELARRVQADRPQR